MPAISIIVPVYKTEKYIHKCIDSILAQTYRDFELILVDDGSPDQCGRICDEYAAKDERCTVIHQENIGPSGARNAGLDIASGEYIMFVDSDDYISKNMVQVLYDAVTQNYAELAICGFEPVDNNGSLVFVRYNYLLENDIIDSHAALKALQKNMCFYIVWAKIFRKELFDNIRFPIQKVSEDIYIIFLIYFECNRIVLVSDKLYYYVQSPQSIARAPKTIRHFDGIEAIYFRLKFYEEHLLTDFLMETTDQLFNSFLYLREKIKLKCFKDLKRYLQVKGMVRYGIRKYGKNISLKQKLIFEFPHACKLFHRGKLMAKSTVSNLKSKLL